MDGETASFLAPAPRTAPVWEKVAVALAICAALFWGVPTLFGSWSGVFTEMARGWPSSALVQAGQVVRKFPSFAVALALVLATTAFTLRLWGTATPTGRVVVHSLRVLARSWHIALFLCVLNGGLSWWLAQAAAMGVLDQFFGGERVGGASIFSGSVNRSVLFASEITQMVVILGWNLVVGAFAASAGIYLWVQHEKGRQASLYEAVNYALNRYPRVFKAHALAYLKVYVGMIFIVPGILFGLQYAFVDAIATLDAAEKDPLKRSRKLTSNRRGTIFRTFAAFAIWWVPVDALMGRLLIQAAGPVWYGVAGVVEHFILLAVEICMVQYYLDLFRKPAERAVPAPPTAEPQPAQS